MVGIATYVFVDLETTSIPYQDLNKTRIVEMSMIAVKRTHILDAKAGVMPRVQQKVTMCFNPGRVIQPGATDASGLDNFLVEHETPFNIKVFNIINSFLGCLQAPVCLIAENGHTFDFPILKCHFERLGVQLSDSILCADSLHAFYDMLKPQNTNIEASCDPQSVENSIQDEQNKNTSNRYELNNNVGKNNMHMLKCETNVHLNSPLSMKQLNETTPKSGPSKITPAKRINQARRKLFYEGDEKPKQGKYKLQNIYEDVLGRPSPHAHRAEHDCIMTAEIAIAKATQFVHWVDNNHCAFSEVKPMTPGVPVGY